MRGWGEKNAGFAHNRLSILDVSEAAHQPFTDERYILCYNGEIYNYRELKRELFDKEEVFFRSNSDTEVLFHCLVRHGVAKTVRALRGMFAFSFYDRQTQELYLCRDRFGIKPLAYVRESNALYWASEVKALATVLPSVYPDPVRSQLSMDGLAESSASTTVFKGVKQVPPGTYLKCRPGKAPVMRRYFHPIELIQKEYTETLGGETADSLTTRCTELLHNSVQSMLMSDVPLGTFVSGGLDSSLIAATAQNGNENINLFTTNVLGRYSELPKCHTLANYLGAELYTYDFSPDMMLRDWAETTYHNEYPIIAFPNAIPFSKTARLAQSRHVKPVLTGEGSDELFSGYTFLYYRELQSRVTRLSRWIERLTSKLPHGAKVIRRLRAEEDTILNTLIGRLRRCTMDSGNNEAWNEKLAWMPSRERRYKEAALEMLSGYPLVGLLHRNDRMGMMASIESRFPFLDEEVVRFALNLPERWKRRLSWTVHDARHPFVIDKYILRQAARSMLPNKLADAPKWDFKMYGHSYLRVDTQYFRGGYIQELFDLSSKGMAELSEDGRGTMTARLTALDVFGRIFAHRQDVDSVADQLCKHIKIETGDQ